MLTKITPTISFFLITISVLVPISYGGAQNQTYKYNGTLPEGYSIQKANDRGITINFSMNQLSVIETPVNGEVMKNLSVTGMFLPNDAGYPDLPGNCRNIAIPQGSKAVLKIISYQTETIKNIDIAPAPVIPLVTEEGPLHYEKNTEVYSKNASFPENPVKILEQTKIRGVDVARLGITPFQYNPVTKELIVYHNIKLEITFEGGNGHFGEDAYRNHYWDKILQDVIFNYNQLPAIASIHHANNKVNVMSNDTSCEYAILIPNSTVFAQWADSVKKFRTEQGISTNVFKLSDLKTGTTAAGILSWVTNAYNNWTTKPVAMLMLADYGNVATSTITSNLFVHPGGFPNFASDNYYADVTGDDMPEIVFSRIVANNATELQTMCTKFLNYERNPPTDPNFYSKPIITEGWQDDRWFQVCGEIVGGYLKSIGKTQTRANALGSPASNTGNNVPNTGNWSTNSNTPTVVSYFGTAGLKYIPDQPGTLGGFSGATATTVNTAINNGAFMLLHRDHGYYQGWGDPVYSNTNISSLTNVNNKLPFVFSINCQTGAFHNSTECFAEKFHRYTKTGQNSGALGLIGDAETSYSFVNDVMVWGMFDHLWPNFMPANGTADPYREKRPAFANVSAKYYLQASTWAASTNKQITYRLYHMFGDAFQWFYSEVPKNLTVTYNPVIGPTDLTFGVSADSGSFIALTTPGPNGPVILGTATGTGAPVSIRLSQPATTTMLVTVTRQDYFRYSGTATVGSTTGVNDLYAGNSDMNCYPNPFSQSTTISYTLGKSGNVKLSVFDMLGKEVAVIIDNAAQSTGIHQVQFNAKNLPKGIYNCVLKTDSKVITKSIVVSE